MSTERLSNCIDCGVEVVSPGRVGPLRKRCDHHRAKEASDKAKRWQASKRNQQILSGARATHCFVCGVEFMNTDGRRGTARRTSSRKRICGSLDCYREWAWFRDLDVPIGTYARLLAEQDGKCALCSRPHEATTRGRLRLDHCHATGVVRGLLCNSCNGAVGVLGDSVDRLEKVITYLGRA